MVVCQNSERCCCFGCWQGLKTSSSSSRESGPIGSGAGSGSASRGLALFGKRLKPGKCLKKSAYLCAGMTFIFSTIFGTFLQVFLLVAVELGPSKQLQAVTSLFWHGGVPRYGMSLSRIKFWTLCFLEKLNYKQWFFCLNEIEASQSALKLTCPVA